MGLKELKERALKDPAVKKEYDKLEEEFKAYDETAYLLRSKKNASRLLASIEELEGNNKFRKTACEFRDDNDQN